MCNIPVASFQMNSANPLRQNVIKNKTRATRDVVMNDRPMPSLVNHHQHEYWMKQHETSASCRNSEDLASVDEYTELMEVDIC